MLSVHAASNVTIFYVLVLECLDIDEDFKRIGKHRKATFSLAEARAFPLSKMPCPLRAMLLPPLVATLCDFIRYHTLFRQADPASAFVL